jgi:uncharacterized membrane protein YbhN (UPF0104 family)
MRSTLRTIVVLALAALLLALFFRNVEVSDVAGAIADAHPGWLGLSLATIVASLALRSSRWQYLLAPIGAASFWNAFRATAVGFAARSVLPAAAGELVRPYFLSRRERINAAGALATVVVERLLDIVTVLLLLGVYVVAFGRDAEAANPSAFRAVTWAGGVAAAAAIGGIGVLFALARDPRWLARTLGRLARMLPAAVGGVVQRLSEKFAEGLEAIRRPERLVVALLWSIPLWLCIAVGIWAVAEAFPGSFLLIALLTIGLAVPTPGAVGSFHEAFRVGATLFFGAPNDAAVAAALILHLVTFTPTLVLGLLFAAEEGLNVAALRNLAARPEARQT